MKNEILQEVWRNRDEFTREHNYDIDAMVTTLKEMERQSLSQTVDRRDQASVEPSHPKQKKTGTT